MNYSEYIHDDAIKKNIQINGKNIKIERNIQNFMLSQSPQKKEFYHGSELSREIIEHNIPYIAKWLKETYNYSFTAKIKKMYQIRGGFAGKKFIILDDNTTILIDCGSGVPYLSAEFSTL